MIRPRSIFPYIEPKGMFAKDFRIKNVNPVYKDGLLEITIGKPEGVKKEVKKIDVQYK